MEDNYEMCMDYLKDAAAQAEDDAEGDPKWAYHCSTCGCDLHDGRCPEGCRQEPEFSEEKK
jgi:hypothetical protein